MQPTLKCCLQVFSAATIRGRSSPDSFGKTSAPRIGKPRACVYLDDLGINCKPAAALGMKAIKVVDVDQTLADLAAATGLAFDAEEPA